MSAPRRLRRSEVGQAPDPLRHANAMPTTAHSLRAPLQPSPQGEIGLVGTESTSDAHPAFGPSTVGANYKDWADEPKRDVPVPHPHGSPFVLHR